MRQVLYKTHKKINPQLKLGILLGTPHTKARKMKTLLLFVKIYKQANHSK